MTSSGRLGPDARASAFSRMQDEPLDVLVVGGGVTGAGVALDAATRGLAVGCVEARDWAAGTSSRSSKLIHGGLRYLEQRNVALVREALRERTLLLTRLCPHLVRPVPFLYPLTRRGWERAYVGAGVALYDLLAAPPGHSAPLPRHRHLSRRGALELAPALRDDSLVGAVRYYDAAVDDARHTLTVARTAARWGALMASSARVVGLLRDGERIIGARIHDLESGAELTVRARVVVNATGVWTDEVEALADGDRITVRASKGIHLVVPRARIRAHTGFITRTEKSVLFIIPWPPPPHVRHWIIGTTDTPWNLHKAHPAASRSDIAYLLDRANAVLREPLGPGDVEGVYAGLRPLLAGESDATSRLSREHAVTRPRPGLVSIAGGKYTTYRVMARDAVDAAAGELGGSVPASCTEAVPLLGTVGWGAVRNRRSRLAAAWGLDEARVDRLLGRYGSLVEEVLGPIARAPELGQPLAGAVDYLGAEVRYAATHEGALHLDDVLTRRTRASIETWDRGVGAARPAARLLAPVLGWDDAAVEREVAHYEARVAAERESQEQWDDATADAARMGAPDVRRAPS